VRKSQASTPWAWARRNARQDKPARRGAGRSPCRHSRDRIVVPETGWPRLRSSPRIRR
jgi:hypothetical protein